jgi:tRNA (cmo5U34)-methyltransferase
MNKHRDANIATLQPTVPNAGHRDQVFAEPKPPGDFSFTPQVAQVFDDMVSRSVPFYDEMQRMTAEIAAQFARDGSNIYDLGCSTGTTLALLDPVISDQVGFVGIDNSQSMLDQAREKLNGLGSKRSFSLVCADLHDRPRMDNASAVIMTLTLQFVRPLHRERIIKHIFDGLNDQGCIIIFEKLVLSDSLLNRLFIEFYYEMKRRNGYSEVEIAKKREALENVLVPYRVDENIALLREAGFRHVDEFFRWYNFCGILAVK